MSTKQPTNQRELTPLSTQEVRAIGQQLAYFASLYEGAAAEMEKSGISVLETKGATNLSISIERINGSVQSLQSSLTKARTAALRGARQESKADAIAAEVNQRAAKKRKSE